jgi:ferredoxin
VLPRLLDGCTGCRACAEVCPDFVFEVYRFDLDWFDITTTVGTGAGAVE